MQVWVITVPSQQLSIGLKLSPDSAPFTIDSRTPLWEMEGVYMSSKFMEFKISLLFLTASNFSILSKLAKSEGYWIQSKRLEIIFFKMISNRDYKTHQINGIMVDENIKLEDSVKNIFVNTFREIPILAHAPGRINLIGDHTDYNLGYVLPAAIDRGITIALAKNGEDSCRIRSLDFGDEILVDLTGEILPLQEEGWPNYVLGVLQGLRSIGVKLEGFNAIFGGDIPIGSGLSSSAALECAVVLGVSQLLGEQLEEEELIRVAREAEQNFAKVNCGVMDQFTSIMGKKDHAMLLDCENLSHEYLPLSIEGISLVLFDTRVKHSLGDSEYNKRREECEAGVKVINESFPNVKSLRDVTPNMLKNVHLEEKIYNRCLYVVEENIRVLNASIYLRSGSGKKLGKLMFDSHQGLSELYQVSCPELDFLVADCRENPNVLGSRMMGGGFGGCTINLINEDKKTKVIAQVKSSFQQKFGNELEVYEVSAEQGAHIL